ncbi:MAG: ribosome recycling factor [gamma proteobacterium symbiont of Bathyaustriella thionipta]|nr:ribosome recycling factor [gamma proteobacterium symbiont of Bathyaustriella thionipta]MCU7948584.1 ribosome recycling factor [gamma proteobacterium symbiont of Bathyaustriella thionipta]MCU7953295.1 ribosome recycling factor [gamma proteobacterium symbiont of Bathyaustriella thionipta]MCU7955090.1 ribosome recycling factor [gamma proteobacterium symbiont of Bathyaustriella thionipta]MCU7967014.1 ribosome recycling factor [gamma proteobacterium symbiont of Bathyaustriella thionipta]
MINEIQSDANTRMGKSIDSLKQDLIKVRTGRAHTSLLDSISVDYYGNPTPLNQVANISILDSRTLSVQVWEKQMTPVVEKAILTSDLGLNPATSGELMRIPLPPLTEETRKNLIKVVRGEGESAKVAIRNIRRDANASLKELEKEKEISEDDERRGQEAIQKLTDSHVKEVDQLLAVKEKDLMEI